jgi:4-amino-4-deoxy-L-arabinose transferase-like glycosyltransferase
MAVADQGEKTARRVGLALALLLIPLSLFLQLTYQGASIVNGPIRVDAFRYYVTAANLHNFGVYSDELSSDRRTPPASRTKLAPGYPLFLAPFFSIASSTADYLERVTTAQALLGALLPFLTYLLARTQLGVAAAFAAALLTALSPHLVAIGGFLLSDMLFAVVLMLAMLVFVRARQLPAAWWSLLAGVLFGLAQLVREIGVGIPFVLALLYFVPFGGQPQGARRRAAGRALLLLAGTLLVAGPQTYLHARAVEGHPLREANDPWTLVVIGADINLAGESRPSDRDPELERMRTDPAAGAPALLEHLLADPLPHLRWYLGGKAVFLWRWDNLYNGDVYQYPMKRRGFDEHSLLRAIRAVMRWFHAPLHVLALVIVPLGFALGGGWKRRETLALGAPLFALLFYHIALLTVLIPVPRYSIPLRPYVYILAAMALSQIASWLRAWRCKA